MIVAIHQPNYLPWPGYFVKMAMCDTFVFLDHVQYNRTGYTRRTRIRRSNESDQWLTVPLVKHSDYSAIKDLKMVEHTIWTEKHQRLIYEKYHQLPYYDECMDVINPIISNVKGNDYLIHFNIQLILEIKDALCLPCRTLISSGIYMNTSTSDVNINICKTLGANKYISGKGGNNYQAKEAFQNEGIDLEIVNSKQILENQIIDVNLHQCINRSITELWCSVGIEQLKIWIHNSTN